MSKRIYILTSFPPAFVSGGLLALFILIHKVRELYTDFNYILPAYTSAFISMANLVTQYQNFFAISTFIVAYGVFWYLFSLTSGNNPKIKLKKLLLILALTWMLIFGILAAVPYLLILQIPNKI